MSVIDNWTLPERQLFEEGIKIHFSEPNPKTRFQNISKHVGSKTAKECALYAREVSQNPELQNVTKTKADKAVEKKEWEGEEAKKTFEFQAEQRKKLDEKRSKQEKQEAEKKRKEEEKRIKAERDAALLREKREREADERAKKQKETRLAAEAKKKQDAADKIAWGQKMKADARDRIKKAKEDRIKKQEAAALAALGPGTANASSSSTGPVRGTNFSGELDPTLEVNLGLRVEEGFEAGIANMTKNLKKGSKNNEKKGVDGWAPDEIERFEEGIKLHYAEPDPKTRFKNVSKHVKTKTPKECAMFAKNGGAAKSPKKSDGFVTPDEGSPIHSFVDAEDAVKVEPLSESGKKFVKSGKEKKNDWNDWNDWGNNDWGAQNDWEKAKAALEAEDEANFSAAMQASQQSFEVDQAKQEEELTNKFINSQKEARRSSKNSLGRRRSLSTGGRSSEGDVCVLCCDTYAEAAQGWRVMFPCNHAGCCAVCVMKNKFLLKDNKCLECIKSFDKPMVLTKNHKTIVEYDEFKIMCENDGNDLFSLNTNVVFDRDLDMMVEYSLDKETETKQVEDFRKMVSFNYCPVDGCRWYGKKNSREDLIKHIKNRHLVPEEEKGKGKGKKGKKGKGERDKKLQIFKGKAPCVCCLEHQNEFPRFFPQYDFWDLKEHEKEAHETCFFCGEDAGIFYGKLEANRHLRDKHEKCFACEKAGKQDYWYPNYNMLYEHYKVNHFVCEEVCCWESKYENIFESFKDLQHHYCCLHPGKSVDNTQLLGFGQQKKKAMAGRSGYNLQIAGANRDMQGENRNNPVPTPSSSEIDDISDLGAVMEEAFPVLPGGSAKKKKPVKKETYSEAFPTLGGPSSSSSAFPALGGAAPSGGGFPSLGGFPTLGGAKKKPASKNVPLTKPKGTAHVAHVPKQWSAGGGNQASSSSAAPTMIGGECLK